MNEKKFQEHALTVTQVAARIASAWKEKKKLRIFHGFSHTTREFARASQEVINIEHLNQILDVNVQERHVVVEPNVSFDSLVAETRKYGLVPMVVPEFPKITVGGAILGGAGESSSFKYGGVHENCDEYEVVLGDGQVVTASKSVNSDLFYGLPCSYGSLGVLTLARLRLIPAAEYVELSYFPVTSGQQLLEVIKSHEHNQSDFIDGIMFSKNLGVVMVGYATSKPVSNSPATFSKSSDEWFYLYVLNKIKEGKVDSDTIPITDYFFRYNTGAFWTGKLVFEKLKIPFIRLTRSLLFPYMNAEALGRAVHSVNNSQSGICQDFCLPESNFSQFLHYVDEALQVYPLWICPIKPSGLADKLSPSYLQTNLVINVGMYAKFNKGYKDFIQINRDLEHAAGTMGGRKVLYAHQYYSQQEFWDIYDKHWYDELREKFLATTVFMNIYDKTNVNKRYQTQVRQTITRFFKKFVS